MTQLRDLLTPVKTKVHVDDPENAKLVSVKLHGKGAVRRALGEGKAPKPFVGTRASQGQFIFSRIWARRGAMAIIPPELDGVVVTNEFPVFDIDAEKLDARYFHWLVQSPRFLEQLQALSAGASGQNRVKESSFLSLDVALPSLTEQRRISSILDRADDLCTQQLAVIEDVRRALDSVLEDQLAQLQDASEQIPLGSIAALSTGKSLVGSDEAVESPFRVLKISAVTSGIFNPAESKVLPLDYVPPAEHLVRPGDLLMSRANTAELVGATALVGNVPSNLALPDKIWRFSWLEDSEPLFYHALLSSRNIRAQMARLASGTGGSMKNISKEKLLAMPIPRVAIDAQREFVRKADSLERLRIINSSRLECLSTLQGALSQRAFSGAL